jgi:hypothetical protein
MKYYNILSTEHSISHSLFLSFEIKKNFITFVLYFRYYRKTCIFASLFLRAIINIFIQVIFPNIIKYSDRTFKKEKNDIILLNWCKFYLPSQ